VNGVECGLKACISKKTKQYDFPNKKFVEQCWDHHVEKLLRLAELTLPANDERKQNKALERNWNIVQKANEESRYSIHNKTEAETLYSAIADKNDGVLQWIRKYW
jgi:hypothetical protein